MIKVLKQTAEAFYIFGSMLYLGFTTPFFPDTMCTKKNCPGHTPPAQ